jgi:hypothetical protein
MEKEMRNLNPAGQSQSKSRMLVVMLSLSMLAAAGPCVTQCAVQVSSPIVRKLQAAERQSREAIRFSQRLYRFYKLSREQASVVHETH